MSSTIENMVKNPIMAEDCSQLMDEIINDQTVQMENTIIFLFDNVEQIENERKLNSLAEVIARASFNKRSLFDINNQIDFLTDNQSSASKKTFLKKVLSEIGYWIQECDNDDVSFVKEFSRLARVTIAW